MTITKICCDHCGKELDEMKDNIDISLVLSYKSLDADLCESCLEELALIVKEYCNKN